MRPDEIAINRRTLLRLASASALTSIMAEAAAAPSPLRLVFVHGRGQQGLDHTVLKAQWIETLTRGAQTFGATLPNGIDVAFPYYGDTLDRLTHEFNLPVASDIHAKGGAVEDEFLAFQALVADSLRERSGVTDAQVDVEYGTNPKPKGPLNWEWVQAILRALDKHGGGMSQAAIESFTRDVFLYTTRPGVRSQIDAVVSAALTEQPTVVVGHSLGSVVAYNVLCSDRRSLRVEITLTLERASRSARN
jgi:hypothetical protein